MAVKSLLLFEDYNREEVHAIFEPGTRFQAQTGSWGLHGLIKLRDRPGDYVFLVTFGKRQGEHSFDEGISNEGLLRWQSQPAQDWNDRHIQCLVRHDYSINIIYLFLRTSDRRAGVALPYTYLGTLASDGYDRERVRPVHFRWRLLNWPIPELVQRRMMLTLEDEHIGTDRADNAAGISDNGVLEETAPPSPVTVSAGSSTAQFRASRRRPDEQKSRELGLAGELLVMIREMAKLRAVGRPELAERVVHTAVVEGDHAGYDIASFFPDGRRKYIEVKTTSGPKETNFFISANEVAFSERHPGNYELCRVFLYNPIANNGFFYSLFGDIKILCELTPTEYRVRGTRSAAGCKSA